MFLGRSGCYQVLQTYMQYSVVWRYYGRDQISFAIGLDRSVRLVPIQGVESDQHPNRPADYYDDMYDSDEDGQISTHPDGSPAVIFDRDSLIIEGGDWAPLVYDPDRQKEVIAGSIFDKLREGVDRQSASEDGRIRLWLFPFMMSGIAGPDQKRRIS